MILIHKILISEDIFDNNFVCNLNKCKGACCIEGDYGAPLESEELNIIEKNLSKILPYLTDEGKHTIEQEGFCTKNNNENTYATALINAGACVFVNYDKDGTAKCGIEKAFIVGDIDWKKPISCHLYPIRVTKNTDLEFEYINYDRWEICSPACVFGDKLEVKIYQFLKEPLIRKYGSDFYEELEIIGNTLNEN